MKCPACGAKTIRRNPKWRVYCCTICRFTWKWDT